MNAAKAVASILKREGVECLFCFPINQVIDAGAELGIRPIMARTERAVLGMADGYNRATNRRRTGVCAVQYGPGTENTFGGLAQAYSDSTPILFLPGGAPEPRTGVQPGFDAVLNFQHVTKWVARVNRGDRIPEFLRRAFTYLRTGRPGPIALELPWDLMLADVDDAALAYTPVTATKSMANRADVATAVRAMVAAKLPLIHAGLYTVGTVDAEKDKRNTDVWMTSWDGTDHVRLTSTPDGESRPRWSPDGRYLAFLASRGTEEEKKNGSQVWLLNRAGGEAEKLTDVKGGVSDYAWSPDSKRLVLVVEDQDPTEDPEKMEGWKRKTTPPIVIDRFWFKRDRTGYLRPYYPHLWLFDIAGRKAEQLTSGPYDDQSPAWSPGGARPGRPGGMESQPFQANPIVSHHRSAVLGLTDDTQSHAAELFDDPAIRDGLADHGESPHRQSSPQPQASESVSTIVGWRGPGWLNPQHLSA